MIICHPVRLSLWFYSRTRNRWFKSRDFLLFLNTSPSSEEDAFVRISAFLYICSLRQNLGSGNFIKKVRCKIILGGGNMKISQK